jgi:metal-responsive CopG/Arc/MetJ family transcriptional regulator
MKTAISIPDAVFRSAEQFARRSKMSRSELFTKAVAEYVEKHRHRGITEALDEVYGKTSSNMDPVLSKLQEVSIFNEDW